MPEIPFLRRQPAVRPPRRDIEAAAAAGPITGHPDGISRRRFLGGAMAATGASVVLPTWLAGTAAAATALDANEGTVVLVTLGGGNDGLNTLVPLSGARRSRYEKLRGVVALPAATLLPATPELGFHPSLKNIARRFGEGKVAVVQGSGFPDSSDLSHFRSMGAVMAGTAGTARDTGWLGRYLDGDTEWDSGLRGMALGTAVPLHLRGKRAKVTAVPQAGVLWGSDLTAIWEPYDAIRAMAAAPTELGLMADKVAAMTRDAVDQAATIGGHILPAPTGGPLTKDLTIAARLLNAGLGVRTVHASFGSFDTHSQQLAGHAALLAEVDAAVEAFYATASPVVAAQTVLVFVSEFGRRAGANLSLGTDHGRAGHAIVVGDKVQGGLLGAYPSLDALDAAGNLVPTVDVRSLYSTILDDWLDADADEIVGGGYERLPLFRSAPGA